MENVEITNLIKLIERIQRLAPFYDYGEYDWEAALNKVKHLLERHPEKCFKKGEIDDDA